MAKKSLMVKTSRLQSNAQKAKKAGKKVKFCTRIYNRCHLCGRSRGYIRKFQICRICFRFLAAKGLIPGLTKSSW